MKLWYFLMTLILVVQPLWATPELHFEKEKIVVGGRQLSVEIADTDAKREHGLMFRKHLPDSRGMLFVFENPRPVAFWMKNTEIPLSIGFYDQNRVLLNIEDMLVSHERDDAKIPRYYSDGPAQYALEVPLGWFKKHKVKTGSKFNFLNK